MTCVISSLQSPHLDSELIETLSRSAPNEDRSSDGRAISFILPVYQLVLSRLGLLHVTSKSGGMQEYKNNLQRDFTENYFGLSHVIAVLRARLIS